MSSVIPDPLHPALVHFPIVLAMLLPLIAVGALWAIRRGARPLRAWGAVTAVAAALALSSWVAVETGEREEETVEAVVPERALESHEEAAEAFMGLAGVLLLVTAAGLARGTVGRAARALGTVGAIALVGAGWRVGHTGGELVYRHGAASAYAHPTSASGQGAPDPERKPEPTARRAEPERESND
jgi:uncharacterized membrane protein